MNAKLLFAALLVGGLPWIAQSEIIHYPLDDASELSGFVITGEGSVTIDTEQVQAGTGAMKVTPGAVVTIPVSSSNTGGTVSFWFYDDQSVPTDPLAYHRGPLFGLADNTGKQLCVGRIFAHYLKDDGLNFIATFNDPDNGGSWYNMVTWLTGFTRGAGWSHWTFDMDPAAGLSIYKDGVLSENFSWADRPLPAFNSIVIHGDQVGGDVPQTFWIDDIEVETKGPMQINPDGTPVDEGPVADVSDIEFDSEADLEGAVVSGAFIDTDFKVDGAGSLRVEPGATVIIPLSEAGQTGTFTFYQYDDMTVPANSKTYRKSMRWGFRAPDGALLTIGGFYASYLAGETNYIAAYLEAGSGNWYGAVQHLSEAKRTQGWHKWVFTMDPDSGLTIYIDNILINRFDWAKAPLIEFKELVLYGDEISDDNSQTFWIDNFNAQMTGPSNIDPEKIDPIAPPDDPEYTGPPIGLVDGLESTHPRLCFTAETLQDIKDFYKTPNNRFAMYLSSVAGYGAGWNYNRNYVTNATEGQRVGLWYLPTMALNYLCSTWQTGHRDSAIAIMQEIMKETYWESGSETDCGMSAGNVMGGMALAFDWLYNDLDPDFREQVRKALWTHARRMYHAGHLGGDSDAGYWTSDPQNNHRWHRNYGFILATIAAYTGAEEEQWLLSKAMEEMELIMEYLPRDGSNHEGPGYAVFGMPHIYAAAVAADTAWGTNYQAHPYFRNLPFFYAMSLRPSMDGFLGYGDYNGGLASYSSPVFGMAEYHGRTDIIGVLQQVMLQNPSSFQYTWFGLIGYHGMAASSADTLPSTVRFPDMDFTVMKEATGESGVAATFKCGPTGGYELNRYRDDNNYKYVNVAHDDPDANSFTLYSQDGYLVPPDGYSYSKKSANHNTILVNGKGQENPGRPEGGQWTQPSTAKSSMSELAYLTNYKDVGGIVLSEGEAADYYRTGTVNRYRRSFIWNEGKYILVFDDIRGSGANDITWLIQSPTLTEVDAVNGQYELSNGNTSAGLQVIGSAAHVATIMDSPADSRNTLLGYKQLRLAFDDVTNLTVASVIDPWAKAPTVEVVTTDADNATITVTGEGYVDTWTWTAAPDDVTASSLVLSSDDGQSFDSKTEAWRKTFRGMGYRVGNTGLYQTDEFGRFAPVTDEWVHHDEMMWFFSSEAGDGGMVGWSPLLGWLWSDEDTYPWFYRYSDGTWVQRAVDEGGRMFWDAEGNLFDPAG